MQFVLLHGLDAGDFAKALPVGGRGGVVADLGVELHDVGAGDEAGDRAMGFAVDASFARGEWLNLV